MNVIKFIKEVMPTRGRRCLQGLDIYGSKMSFQFEGKNHYPSIPGAILSVVTMLFIAGYTALQFRILVSRGDNKYQSFEELNYLDLDKVVNGTDAGIQISYIISTYGVEY